MKSNFSRWPRAIVGIVVMSAVIGLTGACSLFSMAIPEDKHTFFAKDLILYQEYNFSEEGDMKKLMAQYPFIAEIKDALLNIISEKETDPYQTKADIEAFINGKFAIGVELSEPIGGGNTNANFLLHINLAKKNHLRNIAGQIEEKYKKNINIFRSEKSVKGIKIISFKKNANVGVQKPEIFSYALLDGYQGLVGDTEEIIEKAILRSEQAIETLAQNEDFMAEFEPIDSNHLMTWFLNSEKYRQYANIESENKPPQSGVSKILNNPLFQDKTSKVYTTEISDDGLKIIKKAVSVIPYERSDLPQRLSGDLISYIPDDSIVWVYGRNLNDFLSLFYDALTTDRASESLLKSFEKASNISIEQDIIAWTIGEFAFSMTSPSLAPKIAPINGGLVIRGAEEESTLRSWRKLEPILLALVQYFSGEDSLINNDTDKGFQSIKNNNGMNVRGITLGEKIGDLALIYGFMPESDNFFIASSETMMRKLLMASQEGKNISMSKPYEKIHIPEAYSSAFGINTGLFVSLFQPNIDSYMVGNKLSKEYEERIKPHFQKMGFFGGYNSFNGSRENGEYTLFIDE